MAPMKLSKWLPHLVYRISSSFDFPLQPEELSLDREMQKSEPPMEVNDDYGSELYEEGVGNQLTAEQFERYEKWNRGQVVESAETQTMTAYL